MKEINKTRFWEEEKKRDYKMLLKIIISGIGIVLIIDAIGLLAWALSGQFPPDNVYVGRITVELLRLIIR